MSINETLFWAKEIKSSIEHAIEAHINHYKEEKRALRYHDEKTPYVVHPIWCAMTLLTETKLSDDIRRLGYQALLWHDILEDTNLPLPDSTDQRVADLVHEMTFQDSDEEKIELWNKSDNVKLLKLYDKVSNLLDGTWMEPYKWNQSVDLTIRLAEEVFSKFGDLNIVKMARAICVHR